DQPSTRRNAGGARGAHRPRGSVHAPSGWGRGRRPFAHWALRLPKAEARDAALGDAGAFGIAGGDVDDWRRARGRRSRTSREGARGARLRTRALRALSAT